MAEDDQADQADEDPGGWVGVSSREAEGGGALDQGAYVPARHIGYVDSRIYAHKTHKVQHPPIQCPNPTRASTMRGFYYCPGCGTKVKLDEEDWKAEYLARQDERLSAWAEGIRQAAVIVWETVFWLVRLAWWALGRVAGWVIGLLKWNRNVTKDNGGVPPEMIAAAMMMAKIMAQNRGSETVIPAPAPEPAISPAKETAEIES